MPSITLFSRTFNRLLPALPSSPSSDGLLDESGDLAISVASKWCTYKLWEILFIAKPIRADDSQQILVALNAHWRGHLSKWITQHPDCQFPGHQKGKWLVDDAKCFPLTSAECQISLIFASFIGLHPAVQNISYSSRKDEILKWGARK